MKSTEIRKRFFDFFIKRNHEKIPSSSLIPAQDPTLLFANAGMNQFKDVFLGIESRSYKRAVTIQKCVRAGGKHNDLDNVGFTKRHLTFFEMMGNFSFGDYFKKEAIRFAWDFLTQEMGLSSEKLHVSVFQSDDEAYEIWHSEIGVPKDRIHRLGAADNFWQMGDSGPCGPCTEIYVDRGEQYGKGTFQDNLDGERFLEVWNLVFMQFDRQADGSDRPLAKTGVDTGMGLERLASIVQNKDSVYQTDLFMPLIEAIEEMTHIIYTKQSPEMKAAFHVLADHIRSCSLIIADGGAPSNEGRGYVLRKIIRRAALFSQKFHDQKLFVKLADVFINFFAEIYPELLKNKTHILEVLDSEVQKFSANLVRGQALLNTYFDKHAHDAERIVSGAEAFKLYDTYGFPLELIQIMAKDRNFCVDKKEFELLMQRQKTLSGQKAEADTVPQDFDLNIKTEFTGYTQLQTQSIITALVHDDASVKRVPHNSDCWVIAERSPFFIVGGGQVPDQGWLQFGDLKVPIQQVKFIGTAIAAYIKAPASLQLGDPVLSIVDLVWRTNAMKNHTATHLLHTALMKVLGEHVKQSGSLVHPDYLRFDFLHHDTLTAVQIKAVEDLVNEKIRENIPIVTEFTTLADAQKRGVIAFFGDKYNPEKVRIVQINDFSSELCGGTHVRATGDIGVFKITESTALAAGYRRIVALTGIRALELFQDTFETIKSVSQHFKVKREAVGHAVMQLAIQCIELQKEVACCKQQIFAAYVPQWLSEIKVSNTLAYAVLTTPATTHEELRCIAQQLIAQKAALYILISDTINQERYIVCQLAPQLTGRVDMQKLGTMLKDTYAVRGGGNKMLFQGSIANIDIERLQKDVAALLLLK